ncbi:FdhF/YdeP family oxidoreductase [Acidiphilium sp.]|uniref:FdhF/YdeP family oxidoreductase n=1 Tax=Acidiphilium sp. TaxID=527 RepID=UPI003CFDA9ED
MADQDDIFAPYDAPAGGWGALAATAKALRRQSVVARGSKALLAANQPEGFDCPGCAWPDPKHTSSFEFCENGAKAIAWEVTDRRVTRAFFARHTVSELAAKSDLWLEEQGRLTEPMRYDPATDHYVPVSWDEAFAMIGRHINAMATPHQAEFYVSGRTSNEAAFLFALLGRLVGTNNFPDCSNMCHEPTSRGLPLSIGVGKGTAVLEDFEHADMILSIGQNPGTNSPRAMGTLREAAKRGARIVVFNPLRERALERFADPKSTQDMLSSGAKIAHLYCQVKIGGDLAALKGVMKLVVAADRASRAAGGPAVLDDDFIASHTHGFDAFIADLDATGWDEIVETSGLSRATLQQVADIYCAAKSVILMYGMGITQHRHGSENIQQCVNLLLLRGNIGRPGTGISPVRGHSNVQGDRTVGIDEKPTAAYLDRLGAVFGFEPPREHGHGVVTAIEAMIRGDVRVFIGMGGNFVAAVPDTPLVKTAMRRLDLTVGINTKLNRGHLVHGKDALILPCRARSELDEQGGVLQSVTVEDSMSFVHASGGLLAPASAELKSEVDIVCGMAKAIFIDRHTNIDWDGYVADYDRIRDAIEAVYPDLFRDFNTRVRQPGGFRLHNPASERIWKTASGKANFMVFKGVAEDPARAATPGLLRLATLRSHDQYNTTIYSNDDRYRGIKGDRMVVFMNAADMAARGIKPGAKVRLRTIADDATPRVVENLTAIAYDIPPGSIGAYYPETNPLLALSHHDRLAETPAAKSIPVLAEAMA